MVNGWQRRGGGRPPPFIDFCHFIRRCDLRDERIAASYRYDLAKVIWPPFCLRESWQAIADFGQRGGWGLGRCYQQMTGGETPTHRHFVISPYLQTDDIFSLFSKFFQHLAHLNGWSSPYFSASFDILWSPNGPSAQVIVQYKKQQQRYTVCCRYFDPLFIYQVKNEHPLHLY